MEKTMCELFAGVGGFRLGMEALASGWNTVWFSQWEPGRKIQHAHDCYVRHFEDSADSNGEFHTGEDISSVDKETIPDHSLLVGGFPCQNYSVATPLPKAKGIEGEKGVLWWQIYNTLVAKKPAFCLFENVDRLLKSPARQRGRDFGIILKCLDFLGYSAEWRVVNAAQYGAAQRRRRTFIFAYRNDTAYGAAMADISPDTMIGSDGLMAKAFPIDSMGEVSNCALPDDATIVSKDFSFAFENAGCMHGGAICTARIKEHEEAPVLLGAVLEKEADARYFITDEKLPKWAYLKGAKKIPRKSADGHEYMYSEGPVAFPDALDKPGRTMLTSEGSVSRCSHAVSDLRSGRIRILTPIETERLQGFPDGWTGGMPERMRYFCMGNALVVPMITRMGRILDSIIANEP